MDFVGGDGGYVKTERGWKRRTVGPGPCLGTKALGNETFEERQEQKALRYTRNSVELYRGEEIPGFDVVEEKVRREFKLTGERSGDTSYF